MKNGLEGRCGVYTADEHTEVMGLQGIDVFCLLLLMSKVAVLRAVVSNCVFSSCLTEY